MEITCFVWLDRGTVMSSLINISKLNTYLKKIVQRRRGFSMLLFPLPPARNKENIEMETMQTLDRDGNSVKPG